MDGELAVRCLVLVCLWCYAAAAQILIPISTGGALILGTVATPTDSPGAGTYSGTQSVTLSSATPGAWICYTTDGGTPVGTATSCSVGTHYTGAISVASTETIKAIAYKTAYFASGTVTSAYTISHGTIGYQTIGSDVSGNWDSALRVVTLFVASGGGSNGTISLYCASASGTIDIAVGVYSDTAGAPATRLSGGTEKVSCTTTPGWRSTTLTGVTWVDGTSYWLALQSEVSGTNTLMYRDSGGVNQEVYVITSWTGALPSTWTGTPNFEFKQVSIYVVY